MFFTLGRKFRSHAEFWSSDLIRFHRHAQANGNSASGRLGRSRRRLFPQSEALEGRLLLTLEFVADNDFSSYVGVGFNLNPVAAIYGTYNGQPDLSPSDYRAQINWGDGNSLDTDTSLVEGSSGEDILIKGSHVYKQQGTYDVVVYVTGPDGESISGQTATATAAAMPDPSSQPITVPEAYTGSQPLGDDNPEFVADNDFSSYVGVGFSLNPVAAIYGTYDGQPDLNPSDYRAQINWGDSGSWDTDTSLVVGSSGEDILVKGSHVYKQQGTYDVVVYVTGPDGQTISDQTATATAAAMPDPSSQPITVPKAYTGSQPLGDDNPEFVADNDFSSYVGVGFSLNPVAAIYGTYNGQPDVNPSDYRAQINWGDSGSWDTDTSLVVGSSGEDILVKGSHVYEQQGTYDVVVDITGPDGQTISDQTATATAAAMPDPSSQPITVPKAYAGSQPLGDDNPEFVADNDFSSYVGVGFSLNPVAAIYGTYNGQPDLNPSDYRAQINWGDSGSWDTDASLVAGSNGEDILIEGSHAYKQQGTYDVVVYVTGPDGQTISDNTATASVSPDSVSATLTAPKVTTADAASESPYSFSLTFQDSSGVISDSSVSGATVQVVPPATAAITATLVSTQLSGNSDGNGDASTITANYQITPPTDSWTSAPMGTYSVNLTGTPVTGVSGGEAPPGTVGTFQVNVAVKLVLEVAQADTSVPEDGTIPVGVQAVGPSGSPDPGASGTVTLTLNGRVVDNVNLQNGTGSTTITAPGQPGQYQLQGDLSNLSTGNTGINVGNEQPSTSELLSSAANAGGQLGDLLKGLLEEDLKDPSQVAQAALKDLEGLKNILGKVVPALDFVPLAIDLGSLWNDATQPASPQNEAQFQKDFSNALKEAIGLDVAWGVTVGLELNPIGAVGGFLLNSAVGQGVGSFYDTYLQAGTMTTAGQLYQALKGTGSSVLLKGGVQYFSGNGDPPPSIILVNPPNASSGADNLSIAGQVVYAQAGMGFDGVVATFIDASANTNLNAYDAYIAWGDGNFTEGTVSTLPGGGFEVSGSDTYTAEGIYSVSVIVTSTDGSSAVAYNAATVYPAGPTGATSAPVVSLLAPDVGSENADWLTPYTFSVVYQDSTMVSYASLSGSTVEVQPPTGPAITATQINTQVLGDTDAQGDGTTLIVTYEITPPGGNWYAAPPGTYTIKLGGSAVTDLSGHPVKLGSAGTVQVSVPPTLDISPVVGTDPSTGASVSNSASLRITGYAQAGSTVTIDNGAAPVGTTQAGADGSWSLSYHAPEDGSYDFTAFFTDSAGNMSSPSADSLIEVDTATPTSTVAPLPATTAATSFTVSWSGSESTGGTGIALYNVYVSDDGGAFALFQAGTTATSATFTGQTGHSYRFYTVAVDYAGNVQPTPTAVQATTTVIGMPAPPPPPPLVTVESLQVEKIKVGKGKTAKKETVLVLQFSGALNAVSADNAGAYDLAPVIKVKATGKGKHRTPATTKLGTPVTPASAVYTASNNEVTLTPRGTFNLTKPEELIVNGALLTDTLGRQIDGNDDGQPGGDYIATLNGTRVTPGGLPLARSQPQPASVEDAIDALFAHGELSGLTGLLRARREGRRPHS